MIEELARSHPVDLLFTLYQKIEAKETCFVSKEVLEAIIGQKTPFTMAALFSLPPFRPIEGERILVLDRLQDPGNVGSLIRSAEAFGFDGVYFIEGGVDPFHDKVNRAARGANLRLQINQGPAEALFHLPLIGASVDGEPIESVLPVAPPILLCLGQEGSGLSPKLQAHCKSVSLPMKQGVNSLNVSHAGQILLYLLRSCGI